MRGGGGWGIIVCSLLNCYRKLLNREELAFPNSSIWILKAPRRFASLLG